MKQQRSSVVVCFERSGTCAMRKAASGFCLLTVFLTFGSSQLWAQLSTPSKQGKETGYAECGAGQKEVGVFLSPEKPWMVATLKCGEEVSVLGRDERWIRMRTKEGKEGYVSQEFLSQRKSATGPRAPGEARLPASPQPQAASSVLTNKDVLAMLKMGLAPEIILAKVKSSVCNFDSSPATLQELKTAGASDALMLAMVQAPVSVSRVEPTRNPPQAAPQQSNLQALSSQPAAAAPASTKIIPGSKVYVEKMDGFENYLTAAFAKKKVQLVPVADKDQADYVISGTSEDRKAGWAKIIFMGNIHSDNAASVTMTDQKTGAIVFAYAVNKKSTWHGQQTSAEACAKHLQAHIEGRE